MVLSSGATLLYQGNPVSPTVAFGAYLTRGSRDEGRSERGFSHLLEHLVFRGTTRRSALEIALELESIGGQWDAFTGKESTCYHGKTVEEHFERLSGVFADIILRPSVPADAFRLERKIVREEIRSTEDSPEEMVHELFFRTVFRGHPLGRPVAGFRSDIARCSREELFDFHARTYTAGNALLGFVGNIPLSAVVKTLERQFVFRRRRAAGPAADPSIAPGRTHSLTREGWGQSHAIVGGLAAEAASPRRHAILILANILGGGVSSRLFQALRERTGYAYAVVATAYFWRDTGVLYSYFSVDPKNLGAALDILREELESLRRGTVTAEELASAKAQLAGSIVLGIESVESRLFRLFHGEVYHRRYLPFSDALRAIERVKAEEVSAAASSFLAEDDLTYVACGPRDLQGLVPHRARGRRPVSKGGTGR